MLTWVLGGLGWFLSALARVTRRCRRPKAAGFVACLLGWRLVALLDVVTGFGPPELGRYTPPSWCQEGAIRRWCACSTWWRRFGGACSERAAFKACARPRRLALLPSVRVGRRVTRRCRRQRALGCCVSCGRWCFFASWGCCVGPPRLNANR